MFARVRSGERVVAAVVEREEVARRQVDVELAGELTRLLRRARRRGEEEDVAVLVDEFDELLRGERGAVAWWEEGRVSRVESMEKNKEGGTEGITTFGFRREQDSVVVSSLAVREQRQRLVLR